MTCGNILRLHPKFTNALQSSQIIFSIFTTCEYGQNGNNMRDLCCTRGNMPESDVQGGNVHFLLLELTVLLLYSEFLRKFDIFK